MKAQLIPVFGVVVCALALGVSATEIDEQQILMEQLDLGSSDAALYWNGVSWSIASLVAGGQRVALDGLGAFEPAYERNENGEVIRTMRFIFDLGAPVEQPCVITVFDEGFLKHLSSFAWLKEVGSQPTRRLMGDEWQKLLDIFVFVVLRNSDGHARQALGMGLGSFFPTADVDLGTERDDNERRVVIDFYADDDSPGKFASQYHTSIDALTKLIAVLERESRNLSRYARITGIEEYGVAEGIVNRVAATWTEERDDLSGSRAQDHNSSRSNKTASIISDGVDELDGAQDALKAAAAQDHNSSRSNKTASAIANVEDGGGWASETLRASAQDHNSSRSNKTASKSAEFYNDLVSRYDGAYSTRVQDHNSSRSNKTASIIVDFDPSPTLEKYFESAATF